MVPQTPGGTSGSANPAGSVGQPVSVGSGKTAPSRTAAFFDLDKTIIATSSAAAFTRPFYSHGLISRRSVLRGAYAQFLYMVGSADHDQTERMRAYLSSMSTGWPVEQVHEIVQETLHELIDPHVYSEAVDLIAEHHSVGRDVVIVSASGLDLVEPIGAMLGADHVIATRMGVEDGKYTGEIEFYAYADAKAEAIKELAAERGYDLAQSYAYSDSITDEPMLSAVGHAYAVNPDRALRKVAAEHEWGVLEFHRPVSLRDKLTEPEPIITAGAVLVAVGAGLALWLVLRHRKKNR